jgi:hypothetical protein
MQKRTESAVAAPASGKKRKLRLAERTGANVAPIVGRAPAQAAAKRTEEAVSAPDPVGRQWTVTVALPGSVVDNAQTHELRSALVGQVARACTVFNVDEIVVFKTESDAPPPNQFARDGPRSSSQKRTPGSVFMARLLQYLECPQCACALESGRGACGTDERGRVACVAATTAPVPRLSSCLRRCRA